MSNDNVIPFPGKEELAGMKSSTMVAKNVAKNKKVTQQQAFGALLEMRQLVDGVINAVGRLSQSQVEYEKILQQVDMNFRVLMHTLLDNKVISEENWETSWNKYVTEPHEKAIDDQIEEMKKNSAEDAYFAEVLTMVRKHEWPEREVNGNKVDGSIVKNFYTQMLMNPATRKQALGDLRKDIPEIPEYNSEEPEEESVQEETRAMPDCKYCGKPDCEFCNSLKENEIVDCEFVEDKAIVEIEE